MRNAKVTLAIKQKYRNSAGSQIPPRIICVSNTAYSRHKEGYDEDDIPLPILTTGIPNLRIELLALPAASKLNVLKLHIRGVLPTLLETLLCWSSATT